VDLSRHIFGSISSIIGTGICTVSAFYGQVAKSTLRGNNDRLPLYEEYAWTVGTETFLTVDVGTLEVRAGGPAIAGIWLVTESGAFPEAGWSDFAIVILGWWASALLNTIRSNGVQGRVHFMDGPYAVDVAMSDGILHFRLISRDREIGTGEAALGPFVSAFISQSRSILHTCRSREWWCADADTLESLLGELKREMAQL